MHKEKKKKKKKESHLAESKSVIQTKSNKWNVNAKKKGKNKRNKP